MNGTNFFASPSPVTPGWNGFRLSLSSTLPVPTSDITAATTLYLLPYTDNRIWLMDSAGGWKLRNSGSTTISYSISGFTASTLYDLWCYNNAGTPALDVTAWSNSGAGTSTRATALAYKDGVAYKTGDYTRRYVGTFRTTSTTGQTEDSGWFNDNVPVNRLIWNQDNRVIRPIKLHDSTAGSSHNYNTSAWRNFNANANMVVNIVSGMDSAVDLNAHTQLYSSSAGSAFMSFRVNGAGPVSGAMLGGGFNFAAGAYTPLYVSLRSRFAAGYHTFAWQQYGSGSGTNTWYSNYWNGVNGMWGY